MSRHLADHNAPSDGGRVRHFVDVERKQGDEGTHPASKALRRRPQARNTVRRTEEFLRIDRGRTA